MHKSRIIEIQPARSVLPPRVEREPLHRLAIRQALDPLQHHHHATIIGGTLPRRDCPTLREIGYCLMVARNRKRLKEFSDGPPTSAPANKRSGTQSLSQRELELLALLAEAQTDQQIATTLSISLRTVRSYLDRIRDKTGCRRRPELTRLAVELGLLAGNP